MATGEGNFSLGVTQLLDELLAKDCNDALANDPVQDTNVSTSDNKPREEDLRNMFQRTEVLCEEARAFFNLIAKADEVDAKVESEMQRTAENCSDLGVTSKSFAETANFFGTMDSLSEALDANEVIVAQILNNILDEKEKRDRIEPGEGLPEGTTVLFETGTFARTQEPEFDLDRLLSECVALRDETKRYRGMQDTFRSEDLNSNIMN